jgi:DNA-directed RNA polymerase specialized sigma24 family protein
MESERSISHWLDRVREGDPRGAHELWERYYAHMVRLARARLGGVPAVDDAEDVALSAFASFCRRAGDGQFPVLADRDDLWRLLVVITARKAGRVLRGVARQKRGGDRDREAVEPDELIGATDEPGFVAQCAEECRTLLARLGDPELARLAVRKMEGFTNDELAAEFECAPRTVERKLQLIRRIWERADSP